ncbi:MAG: hypothetical protein RLZZ08_836 [Pseudomonadota bacterium]|jgi:hypothetical protein
MIKIRSFAICATMLLGACAGPYYKTHEIKSGTHLVARDATISVAVVERNADGMRLCMQSSPDATFDQDAAVSLSASLANFGSGGGGQGEGSDEAEMAGRSPALLFARELFYRTCEVAMSTKASPEEWRAMFTTAMQTSAEIMKLEAQNTRVDVKEDVDNEHSSSMELPATVMSASSAPVSTGMPSSAPSNSGPPPSSYNPSNVPPPSSH